MDGRIGVCERKSEKKGVIDIGGILTDPSFAANLQVVFGSAD